ncbi:hypothetical protein J31TS4_17750 [Paenibacillus sp. J31TS4]|uniref:DUF4153 domain-containing protein n=1 Tax=Paenibacillus sp. J31TS4 TaxID=2807195 RepID=UPI001B0A928C|nr:DUF4173 domain-containing protein [Paenibacillus sp. J31TS4]GIP38495.1 hypothetical protein J31TS4_17750 [Paenibacillus sp. J31TS4]
MSRRLPVLLLGCLGLGFLFQLLFVFHAPGLSYPLFVLAGYALYGWWTLAPGSLRSPVFWIGFAYSFLLALTFVLFDNAFLHALNGLGLPLFLLLHTVAAADRSGRLWRASELLQEALDRLLLQPILKLPVPFRLVRSLLPKRKSGQSGPLGQIALGATIALPLLVLVLLLLASADSVFREWTSGLPNWIGRLPVAEGGFRLAVMVVVALASFGYMLGLVHPEPRANEPERGPDEPGASRTVRGRGLDPVASSTVLLLVNAVYLLFSIIQFSYLFGAGEGRLPGDVTYAEYARKGFAELVIVSVLNLGLLLGAVRWSKAAAGRTADRVLRLLLALLVGFTGILLVSAHLRLALYEEAYGFTSSRLLGHAFMLLLAVWLLLALLRVWRSSLPLGRLFLLTGAAAYLVLNYVGIDAWIVRSNSERYAATGRIDLGYLESLSADAVPPLIELGRGSLPPSGLAETLARFRSRLDEPDAWQSLNAARLRARRLLTESAESPAGQE